MFLVGSKNCPCTYINEVRQDTTFDTTNPDMLATLIKHAPDYATNPLSAINCIFEEKFDPSYNVSEGCWGKFDQCLMYYHYCNINVVAVRDVTNAEEFLISYQKPESLFCSLNHFFHSFKTFILLCFVAFHYS